VTEIAAALIALFIDIIAVLDLKIGVSPSDTIGLRLVVE